MVAAKNTTAPAPKTDETPAVPALDFTKLSAVDAPANAVRHSRKTTVDLKPLQDLLTLSKAEDKVKRFTVLAAQAPALVNKIREAAKGLPNMGVSVKVDDAGEGNVHVNFKGKDKAKRPTKAEKAAKAEAAKSE